MIRTDEELRVAQGCIGNLEQVLMEAKRTHSPAQYRVLAASLLLELQQRQQEILEYLMEPELPAGSVRAE
ncbi:MAG: hypothetical protein ABSA52_16765 [Candidatus Binatia bacterium]|jgi:hypothetical protein